MADSSTPCSSLKSIDLVLHQTLSSIFSERCLTEAQIKEFLRTSEHTDPIRDSIIQLIPEQKTYLTVDISEKELGKLSLLWIAVLAGYNNSAELLVLSGADVNERHELSKYLASFDILVNENSTILHVLVRLNPSPENDRLFRLITDHDADLQARDGWGRTALHFAIENGQVQMTEMLLEKGADVNAADDDGMTPFLEAASNIMANELLPLLMRHGADIFVKNFWDENALHRLTHAPVEYPELARVLIEKGVSLNPAYDDRYIYQCQPIHLAAAKGRNELVKLFLDHGANVNSPTKWDDFPLYFAALFNNGPAVLETLLKRGANIHQRTTAGSTALHAACKFRQPHLFDLEGENKLHFEWENVRELLFAGADVLVEDCNGYTPFALLMNHVNWENQSIRLMISLMMKALALKKVCQPSIKLKDERIIARYPMLLNYYNYCLEEIRRMKSKKFIKTCTFFELLTRCQCHIAGLMRNPSFETEFGQYDLSEFSIYAEDITRAFERAQNHYHAVLEQEDVIEESVYNILPYMLVKKIVHYIFNCCGT